jgi:glucose/arabinose dehydrogenase
MRLLAAPVLALLVASACSSDDPVEVGPDRDVVISTTLPKPPDPKALLLGFELEALAQGLEEPVGILPVPGADDVFFIERTGQVVTASSRGVNEVLSISSMIGWDINEQGFLGFAVHPRFPQDPRGFAVFTNHDLDVVIASFEWDGAIFDPATRSDLLLVPQPHQYHQGGSINFGPDGNLWMSFGDGGGASDRFGNAQNPETLNGSIVRIDVDHGEPYAIPPSNPYIGTTQIGNPAIWAIGLRNPWRFTFDGSYVIIADVGDVTTEEINIASVTESGLNFGWPIREGSACHDAETCTSTGLTDPALDIPHDGTCAVIGGHVYYGQLVPEMYGHYVYGDYCTGWIRSAPHSGGRLGEPIDWTSMIPRPGQITTFGLDLDGELLIATLEGAVYRLVPVRSTA